MLRLLDIPARPLVEREKNYIASWDAMGFDEAITMIREGKCGTFNPELLENFWKIEPEIRSLYRRETEG